MIQFLVSKDEIQHTFECDPSDTIQELKQKIMEENDLEDTVYIDLELILEKPIRSLGKFNVEPGIIPRTLDRYQFNRFELDGKKINATYHVIQDYKKPIIKKRQVVNTGAYRAPVGIIESGDSFIDPVFNIESEDDFPSL